MPFPWWLVLFETILCYLLYCLVQGTRIQLRAALRENEKLKAKADKQPSRLPEFVTAPPRGWQITYLEGTKQKTVTVSDQDAKDESAAFAVAIRRHQMRYDKIVSCAHT